MELRSIFGLPAHPLIVHGAVVLLPLAALALVIAAVVPRWRRVAAPLALALGAAASVFVFLAEQSGEQLEHHVRETAAVEEHTHAADAVLPWALFLTAVAAGAVAAEVVRPRLGDRSVVRLITPAVVVLALVSGVGATATVVSVGHSGAEATWKDVSTAPSVGEDDGDGDGD